MRITERRLRQIIRSVIKESKIDEQEDMPQDPDLADDQGLMSDIMNTARQIPEGIKIKSAKSIKQLRENRDLNSQSVKEFISGSLDANGKLIALFNLDLHGNHGKLGTELVGLGAGGLLAKVTYVINVLAGHGFWVKMFGATLAGGFAALNTVIGLSVAVGAVGYWLTKKAIKNSNMSSVSVPDWYEMKEFKKSINLNEKDLLSMSLEELCEKYNIPMP